MTCTPQCLSNGTENVSLNALIVKSGELDNYTIGHDVFELKWQRAMGILTRKGVSSE